VPTVVGSFAAGTVAQRRLDKHHQVMQLSAEGNNIQSAVTRSQIDNLVMRDAIFYYLSCR